MIGKATDKTESKFQFVSGLSRVLKERAPHELNRQHPSIHPALDIRGAVRSRANREGYLVAAKGNCR
jgi:hypothetical protein